MRGRVQVRVEAKARVQVRAWGEVGALALLYSERGRRLRPSPRSTLSLNLSPSFCPNLNLNLNPLPDPFRALTPCKVGCRGRALILGEKQSACGLKPATPQARSSVVEHYLDTVGVGSSILPAPTKAAVSSVILTRRSTSASL